MSDITKINTDVSYGYLNNNNNNNSYSNTTIETIDLDIETIDDEINKWTLHKESLEEKISYLNCITGYETELEEAKKELEETENKIHELTQEKELSNLIDRYTALIKQKNSLQTDIDNFIATNESAYALDIDERRQKIAKIDEEIQNIESNPTYKKYSNNGIIPILDAIEIELEGKISIETNKDEKAKLNLELKNIKKYKQFLNYDLITTSYNYKEFINGYNYNMIVDFDSIEREITREDGGKDWWSVAEIIDRDYPSTRVNALTVIEYIVSSTQQQREKYDYLVIDDQRVIDGARLGYSVNRSEEGFMKFTPYEYYAYLTEDERNMYHYLFYNVSIEEADKYLNFLSDDLNQRKGMKIALDFINSLDKDDYGNVEESIGNFFEVSGQGISDGVDTFFDGLYNAYTNNDEFSANDYARMFVYQYLKDNTNYLDTYEISSSIGNMVPSIIVSTAVSFAATPAAGSYVGNALMGTSSYGNAKHQALVSGYDVKDAKSYAAVVGLSEATLGLALGKIPGLNKLSNNWIKDIMMEGFEEGLQVWVDNGAQAILLDKNVNWSQVPAEARDAFVSGMLVSGIMRGGYTVANITINNIRYTIDYNEIMQYMNDNPDATISEAMIVTSEIDTKSVIFGENVIWDKELNTQQLNIIETQVENFNNIQNSNIVNTNFEVTEDGKLILQEGTLIHGSEFNVDTLRNIKDNGILGAEFIGQYEEAETYYCADFYRVPETTNMEDYVNFCTTPDRTSRVIKSKIENYYLPTKKANKVGFIINPNPELNSLLDMDVYRDNQYTEGMKGIVEFDNINNPDMYGNKDRLGAVLYGVPENAISGIWVSDDIKMDQNKLNEIKNIFPDLYIVDNTGEILYDPNK